MKIYVKMEDRERRCRMRYCLVKDAGGKEKRIAVIKRVFEETTGKDTPYWSWQNKGWVELQT